jgi:hypothetical protein
VKTKIRIIISIIFAICIAFIFNRYLNSVSVIAGNITITFVSFAIISESLKRIKWHRKRSN